MSNSIVASATLPFESLVYSYTPCSSFIVISINPVPPPRKSCQENIVSVEGRYSNQGSDSAVKALLDADTKGSLPKSL